MQQTDNKEELVINIHDWVSSGEYTPSVENIKFPIGDINNAIIEGTARNWTYKTTLNLTQITQEDINRQAEEISAYFDSLLRDYIYNEYKISSANINKKRIEIQEKIDQCNHIKNDNEVWSTLDEAQKNDIEESLVEFEQNLEDTMRLISKISGDDNEVEVSDVTDKNEEAEAAFGIDKETVEMDMLSSFDKPSVIDPAKIIEKTETALDILKRIEQKLNDLLVKVDSLIKRIDIMINMEYPQVSSNREEAKAKANESQKEIDAETKSMEQALEKSGTKIEEIETVVKGSGEVLVVQSGGLIEQEIEKEIAEAGRARELADIEAQAHEMEQEERNLRKKSSHMDENLGRAMELDDLFGNINEVKDEPEDKAKVEEDKPTSSPVSKPSGRKI